MIKLTSHFNELCSQFDHLNFCEQMWIYSWCSSRDIHVQSHCTLQLCVQWGHQTWSNSLHTSMNCAVGLITWFFCEQMWIYFCCSSRDIHGQNHLTEVFFVSRCGSTFEALQEIDMVKLTAHFSSVCSKITRHDQTHWTLQLIVQWVWSLEILWADVDLLLMLFKRHTCSNSLHTSVKCAARSPDMIKVTAHFN